MTKCSRVVGDDRRPDHLWRFSLKIGESFVCPSSNQSNAAFEITSRDRPKKGTIACSSGGAKHIGASTGDQDLRSLHRNVEPQTAHLVKRAPGSDASNESSQRLNLRRSVGARYARDGAQFGTSRTKAKLDTRPEAVLKGGDDRRGVHRVSEIGVRDHRTHDDLLGDA